MVSGGGSARQSFIETASADYLMVKRRRVSPPSFIETAPPSA